jgi:signal peptidase II
VSAPAATAGRGSPRRVMWTAFLGLAAVVVVFDQVSKALVLDRFDPASPHADPGAVGGPTRVIGDLVRIALTYNDGGIFGVFGQSATILGIASLGVIAMIVLVEAREGVRNPLLTAALGLLLGGAIGNLIDRLRFGHVVDWVDTGLGDLRWYTFNVADAAISIAIVLLLVAGIAGHRLGRLTGTPTSKPTTDLGRASEPSGRGVR